MMLGQSLGRYHLLEQLGEGARSAMTALRLRRRISQLFDGEFDDGACDKQAADRVQIQQVLFRRVHREQAFAKRADDDAQRSDGRDAKNLRRVAGCQIVC